MYKILPIVAVVSGFILQAGFARAATDQNAASASSQPDGASQPKSHAVASRKHPKANRTVASAPAPGYSSPVEEFALAASYENSDKENLAIPLYQDLIRGGSTAPVPKSVKLDDGAGPRLGATVADEAAFRLKVIASKNRPAQEGAVPEAQMSK
jgi:hypothetical protein